ncbi:MAG: redoxin domain-containing protein [Dehalococcoidia bacterium]|nr:redoxin domain-containing protein [Dehalococcoidia bacterium]
MTVLGKRNVFRPKWRVLELLAVVVVLLMAQACFSSQDVGGGQGNIALGQHAPDFTLADLNGNRVNFSDFRGKVVFINFWATWCPPCRAEMPEIEAVYQEYKDRDVVVLSVDILELEDKVRQFVEKGGYSWVFVMDSTGEISKDYAIGAIPTSIFVDVDGIIRAVNIGAMTKRVMESRLAEAMK